METVQEYRARRTSRALLPLSPFLEPGIEAQSALQLSRLDTGAEVARFTQEPVSEGFFRGERKWCLQIQPTTLDIDMVVLTFIIMEKRRRDCVAAEAMKGPHDEDVPEGGGCEAGAGMG